jgi:hypothetical protein
MTESLSVLLRRILDYAGLYPPAALEMQDAVSHYARHLDEDTNGMLATFVCPAARLEELAKAAENVVAKRPWALSILATGGDSSGKALKTLIEDLEWVDAFLEREGNRFQAAALELRIPAALCADSAGLASFLASVERALAVSSRGPRRAFYEIGFGPHWRTALATLAQGSGEMFRGAKIRTGGLEAAAFPSPENVAAFILAARDAGVSFKATAGLHHPVRRFSNEVGAKMHGFLNVFLGAALAYARGLDAATLVRILNEEDPAQFRFGPEHIVWREHHVELPALGRARREFALSFGSCSYAEPVEDLEALGLL